jgi:hypothetical protein
LTVVVAMAAVGVLTWAGVALLSDAWLRREKRADPAKRLRPFRFDSVAHEAQSSLDDQH